MSVAARREIGMLLGDLQEGEQLSIPQSRPMPGIGTRCHELRVNDENKTWWLMYRTDTDAIVVLEVFEKKTNKTLRHIMENCGRRLKLYDANEL